MEMQIQDLIASIKKDGLDQAKKEADEYLAKARAEADEIVRKAQVEREKLLESAKKEIDLERQSSRASLEQAARDASLTIKRSVLDLLESILKESVKAELSGKALEELICQVVASDAVSDGSTVNVSPDDLKTLSSDLVAKLAQKLKKGIVLRSSASVSGGFVVMEKDGSGFIDLSDEEIAKLLWPYLSENLRKLF